MTRYNDEELLYLSRQGCKIAYQTLVEEYSQLVRVVYHKMKMHQTKFMDANDVFQLAMITCVRAFDCYRSDRNAKLQTFMSQVIKYSMISTMKKGCADYNRYFSYSIDGSSMDDNYVSYEEILADRKDDYQPRNVLFVKEATEQYQGYVTDHCSPLEKEVMSYRMDGYSNQDIAKELCVDIKSIYNAIYRLQKKLQCLK